MTELTTSEARAEAATVVLRLMLVCLGVHERRWLQEAAYEEGESIGSPQIAHEIDWLFRKP